ncbi:DDE-type integrase/transposase/recombinase [Acidithrix sp. C25]|uniref:DDE-type integrase/transposase/recombinase n=1 Tax=Acidithrix sp. C25 TaxID=1671482 RepID=UPI00191B96F0|nr:DDE-type integrase/transposase/recombinase [Acidithrix sp. C25]
MTFLHGPVIDGKKTTLFHFYLPFSKVRIVKWIPDQSLPNVIMALDYCFRYIGGIPAYVLTDNAKTAAVKHIAGVAVINPKMVSFASAYGFSIQTCVVYDPASKGGVEAAVRVAKEDICPKDTNLVQNYRNIAELEAACAAYTTSINSVVHSTSGKIPSVVLQSEAMTFHSLPKVPYLGAYGVMRKVEPKMPIVRFNHCGYSVPAKYRRGVVYVRSVGEEVVIVAQEEAGGYVNEIARHARGEAFSYVIDDSHKEPDHPNGPLVRMPIPTNETQAKFLSITPDASQWLIRACNSGASGIETSIADLVGYANNEVSSSIIEESLRLGAFNHSVIADLLVIHKRSARSGTKATSPQSSKPQSSNGASSSPQGPYGASTDAWSKLAAVS